jgi:CRP/FNR family cyclic AMP-dependent transcriptional regulator
VADRWCSELLGPGDLLRPWEHDDAGADMLRSTSSWTVLEQARVAVLDERFARVACRWPALVSGLVARTLRRSRWMTIMLAISNLTRVDDRVMALLWHLADRWGEPAEDGVCIPVRLTHSLLAAMVLGRRPSVSSTLTELSNRGLVSRTDNGWVLHGAPPTELHKLSRRDAHGGSAA